MATANSLNISQPGIVCFDGTATFTGRTLQPGAGVNITNGSGIAGNPIISATITTDLHGPKIIVGDTANGANYSTITAALAAASSGDTIYLQTGTYTENITLKAGVNIAGMSSDGVGSGQGTIVAQNVTILGTVTATYTGRVNINGVTLQTNGATALSTSGGASGNLILTNCRIYAQNATGITLNSALNINFYCCNVNADPGQSMFVATAGPTDFEWCVLSGSTTGINTVGSQNIVFNACDMQGTRITTSSTGTVTVTSCYWGCGAQTALTTAGTGTSSIYNTFLNTTTATSLTAGSGTTIEIYNSQIATSNGTAAISGAGTLKYGQVVFSNSGSSITTSSVTSVPVPVAQGGTGVATLTGLALGAGTSAFTSIPYETGSWTPVLSFGGASVGITYSTQTGSYTRIGNLVAWRFQISLSSKGSSTGNNVIDGLPYACAATNQAAVRASAITYSGNYLTLNHGSATTALQLLINTTAIATAAATDAAFANTSLLIASGTYLV